MITFKASYISSSTISKLNSKQELDSQPVSFIKFNLKDKNDKKALKKLSYTWIGRSFAFRIYDDFKKQTDAKQKKNSLYFYGLTLQQNSFEKIEPSQMLGIAEVAPLIDTDFCELCKYYTENDIEINFIQTNPKHRYPFYRAEYKHIGQNLIKCISKIFSSSNIWVIPASNAIGFYEKLGFKSFQGFLIMVLKNATSIVKK